MLFALISVVKYPNAATKDEIDKMHSEEIRDLEILYNGAQQSPTGRKTLKQVYDELIEEATREYNEALKRLKSRS
jgi:hypothetical protein